jgi:hypothetical protein
MTSTPSEPGPGIVVASAPVSYGAFVLTVGIDPNVPDGVGVLDEVAAAGYAGIDLGPVGFLGGDTELGGRLAARKLDLAGAYLELPYADHDALDLTLPALDAILDTFDAAAPYRVGPPPRPTLADNGSEIRRARPGRAVDDRSIGLDANGWLRFGRGLTEVVTRCRDRGYEPTFHHETGTYVEAPWEIARVLELTDIGLCLDTGPPSPRRWRSRVRDPRLGVTDQPGAPEGRPAVGDGGDRREWRAGQRDLVARSVSGSSGRATWTSMPSSPPSPGSATAGGSSSSRTRSRAHDLVRAWPSGSWNPGFVDGLAVQAVCDAMELSAAEKRWVSVAEIANARGGP